LVLGVLADAAAAITGFLGFAEKEHHGGGFLARSRVRGKRRMPISVQWTDLSRRKRCRVTAVPARILGVSPSGRPKASQFAPAAGFNESGRIRRLARHSPSKAAKLCPSLTEDNGAKLCRYLTEKFDGQWSWSFNEQHREKTTRSLSTKPAECLTSGQLSLP
jgi:hypothetical protein